MKFENQKVDFNIIPHKAKAAAAHSFTEQERLTYELVTAAQNGDKKALEQLCIFYEPLFRKEMRREIFYKTLGYEEGLSFARLKFIELVLTYKGADFLHFAGYMQCRIHYALFDEARRIWKAEKEKAPLPQFDEAEGVFADNVIEREELRLLLRQALAKLNYKQRLTIEALYFKGYSGRETAAMLKCTPAMVSKHHKQALNILKANIA